MRKTAIFLAMLILEGCSGDDTSGASPDASTTDATANDGSSGDSGAPGDGSAQDTGADGNASADAAADASDGACPAAWTVAPGVDPTIALPDAGGGGVLLHAAANGTQDYTCEQTTVDGGTAYAWVFVGPEADLADCNGAAIGKHFASDAGATAPEWRTDDGSYVIGKKIAAFTPDGGAYAVPWLLLQATSNATSGELAKVGWVQRVRTAGGVTPAAACDVNGAGTTQKVPYTADYYFFGAP
jgi:hypothetical protein